MTPDEWLVQARAHVAELAADAPGRAELEAAIQRVSAKHERPSLEERGAKQGFVSQLTPTSAPELAPQSELPKDLEGEKLVEQQRAAIRPVLERPNEHIVPTERKPGSVLADPILHPLSQLYDYLPSWMGGKTEMWAEPSLVEFRRDMEPIVGKRVKELGLDSPEYKDFANARWADAYDKAASKGENIVRTSAATSSAPDFVRSKATEGLDALGGTLGAAALGATRTAAPGLTPGSPSDRQAVEEEFPVGSAVGGLVGAFSPRGAVGLLSKGLGKATGLAQSLEGSAPSILGGLGRGALVGAGTAGGVQAGQDIGDAVRGEAPDHEAARMALALGGGGVLGALGGAGAAATKGLRNPGETLGRELSSLEMALGQGNEPVRATRFLRGPTLPEGVLHAEKEALVPGKDFAASPTDILAQKVAAPIAESARAEDAALIDRIARQKELYYSTPQGRTMNPPRRLAGELENVILERTRAPLPSSPSAESMKATVAGGFGASPATAATREPLPAAQVRQFQNILNQTVEVIPDIDGGNARAIAAREGGSVRSLGEAQALGLETGLPPMTQDEAARVKVVIKPKPLNAKQLDQVSEALDSLANASSKAGAKDPAWSRLQRAVREDRDRFEWNPGEMGSEPPEATLEDGRKVTGWSAFHTLASRDIAGLEERMRQAGIPQGKNVPLTQAITGVENTAKGFREPNRALQDEALMSFMGGQTGPLWDISAARYGRGLTGPTLSRRSPTLLRDVRLGLDPLFNQLGEKGVPLGVAATSGRLGPGVVGAAREVKEQTPFTIHDMLQLLSGSPQKEKRP